MDMLAYSNSQVNQDLFVLCVLNGKRDGTYIEVGANEPVRLSNTHLLETKFNWRGISFELSSTLAEEFNRTRRNVCIEVDATAADYTNIIRLAGFGNHIDYLQLDIEPAYNTLKALKAIDLERFTFSVITYEHDAYQGGDPEKLESRRILESHGYTRVVSDVKHQQNAFEDWWVREDALENENWKLFAGQNVSMDTPSMTAKLRKAMEQMLRPMRM